MEIARRTILGMAASLPLLGADARAETPAAETARLWRTLFAGPAGTIFAWWHQGMMFAHVDRLREFPVVGFHAVMIARTSLQSERTAVDFRTIGFFADLDTGLPTATWRNVFTDRTQDIPPFFSEGRGRYAIDPAATLTLSAASARANRAVVTAEIVAERAMLTQIEGTLQGFPRRDGTLPPLGDPRITERQTRLQIIAPRARAMGATPVADARGYFTHVYDALPDWLGFGDALGSGLHKGQMRKADATTIVDAVAWRHLRRHVSDAFAGDRLVLA